MALPPRAGAALPDIAEPRKLPPEPFVPRAPPLPAAAAKRPEVEPWAEALPPVAPPSSLWRFFVGENAAVRVGIAVLLLGVGFLLKYAAEVGAFPPLVRLWSAVAFGAGLLGIGTFLIKRRRSYGLALQGGGFGTLFLAIFAAQAFLALISVDTSRMLYVALSSAFLILALIQREESMALFAVVGALAGPIMASQGGSLDRLLAYDLVMAIIVAIISIRFDFRLLPRVAAVMTFIVAGVAGATDTPVDSIATVEYLLAALTVIFGAIPTVAVWTDGASAPVRPVPSVLVFGVPAAAFAMQYGVVEHIPNAMGHTAVVLAAWAGVQGAVVYRRHSVLAWAQWILAVGFATYAIPSYFDSTTTAMVWALEGVGLAYVGLRQKQGLAWGIGLGLEVLAILWVLGWEPGRPIGAIPFVNAQFLGLFAPAFGLGAVSVLMHRFLRSSPLASLSIGLGLVCATTLASMAGWREALSCAGGTLALGVMAGFAAVLAAALEGAGHVADYKFARSLGALLPVALLALLAELGLDRSLWAGGGGGFWLSSVAVMVGILSRHRELRWATFVHLAGALVIAAAVTVELRFLLRDHKPWQILLTSVPSTLILAAISFRPPFGLIGTYRGAVAPVLSFVLAIVLIYVGVEHRGTTPGIPYVPVVGAVDLSLILGMAAVWLGSRGDPESLEVPRSSSSSRMFYGVVALALVATMVARAVHQYDGVGWGSPILKHAGFHATLSLTYGLTGFVVMLLATRRGRRGLYLYGATLLGFVVLKLLTIDLAHSGTLARIISFIGIGIGLLVVGYLIPLPPKERL